MGASGPISKQPPCQVDNAHRGPSPFEAIRDVMRSLNSIERQRELAIACHPATLSLLATPLKPGERIDPLCSIPIHTSLMIPKTSPFSKDPFVEYGSGDQWAVRLGIATEEPVFYQFESPQQPMLLAAMRAFEDRMNRDIFGGASYGGGES